MFFGKKNTLSLWLGILITIAALCYAGFSVSNATRPKRQESSENETSEELEVKKEKEHLGVSNYDDLEEGDEARKNKKDDTNEQEKIEADKIEKKHDVIFHLCMAFASVYFAMLFTNWATDTVGSNTATRRGNVSLGVNIASEWLCFVLYLWTLCAPKIFPERAFY